MCKIVRLASASNQWLKRRRNSCTERPGLSLWTRPSDSVKERLGLCGDQQFFSRNSFMLPHTWGCLWTRVCAPSRFICVTLCHPTVCSLPHSSVHGILQARILERVAMPSSRGSSWPRDQTCVSYISCIGKQVLYHSCHLGSPFLSLRTQYCLSSLKYGWEIRRTFRGHMDSSVTASEAPVPASFHPILTLLRIAELIRSGQQAFSQ